MIFEEKYLFCYISLPDQISISGCLYLVRYRAICVLQLFVNQVVMSHYLSNRAVFSTWPKSHDKNLNILRTKRAFKVKWKAFFIIFKGLSLKLIKIIFLEGKSPNLMLTNILTLEYQSDAFNVFTDPCRDL